MGRPRLRWVRPAHVVAFAVLGFGAASVGCSGRALPARGELVLLLSSDMQVPDSFDTLVVTLASDPAGQRRVYVSSDATESTWFDTTSTDAAASSICRPGAGDVVSTNLALPTTLALLSSDSKGTTTQLTLTLCHGHTPLLTKTLDVTLPAEGETLTQRIALRWLCAQKGPDYAVGCYSCGTTRCYGQPIAADASAESPCAVDACDTDAAYPTAPYAPEEVARYSAAGGASATCFDVLGCFATGKDSVERSLAPVPLRVDWALSSDSASSRPCTAELDTADEDLTKLNLALVLPPKTQGTCDSTRCLLPLEADTTLGWSEDANDGQRLILPDAVCHLLDSGQLLGVMGSRQCDRKPAHVPICGTGNDTTIPDDGEATYGQTLEQLARVHYALDDSEELSGSYVDDYGRFDLTRVSLSDEATSPISVGGVQGQGQAFDSQHFAKSAVAIPHPSRYTVSTWLALTESALELHADGGLLPVWSSLASDCESGFRLSLESCNDGRVQLVFQRPVGKTPEGTCSLESTYAQLSARTWAGGYFSPWKRGDYWHVAVTFTPDDGATFFVDGRVAEASRASCLALATTEGEAENGHFYLGSNGDLATLDAPVTGTVEFDEVRLFEDALSDETLRWLYAHTQSAVGPGGYRWNAWATQGSEASLDTVTPAVASAKLKDLAFSSAGLCAFLYPDEARGVPNLDVLADLSDYDEAVLWARPQGTSFQFSLSADHGRRQCSWQLESGESPYYVINLRQPNWCVDPDCSFDLSRVEQASVASDWTAADGSEQSVEVYALSFRKRLLSSSETSLGSASRLGGLPGPGGYCWRAVSYFPQTLARLTSYAVTRGISLEVVRQAAGGTEAPQLTADLPANESSSGPRDFRACSRIQICTPSSLPAQSLEFVIKSELGQTATWPLEPTQSTDCYGAPLDEPGSTWPTSLESTNGLNAPTDSDEVRARATELALRFAGDLAVTSVSCCDDSGENCTPLSDTVPPTVSP